MDIAIVVGVVTIILLSGQFAIHRFPAWDTEKFSSYRDGGKLPPSLTAVSLITLVLVGVSFYLLSSDTTVGPLFGWGWATTILATIGLWLYFAQRPRACMTCGESMQAYSSWEKTDRAGRVLTYHFVCSSCHVSYRMKVFWAGGD